MGIGGFWPCSSKPASHPHPQPSRGWASDLVFTPMHHVFPGWAMDRFVTKMFVLCVLQGFLLLSTPVSPVLLLLLTIISLL